MCSQPRTKAVKHSAANASSNTSSDPQAALKLVGNLQGRLDNHGVWVIARMVGFIAQGIDQRGGVDVKFVDRRFFDHRLL